MGDFVKRFGRRGQEIKAKISLTLRTADKISQKDIDRTWEEVNEFINTLPEENQGAFFWLSNSEMLFMLTTASKGEIS